MIVYWAWGNFKILVLCIWQFLGFFHLSPRFFYSQFLIKKKVLHRKIFTTFYSR